MSTGFDSIKRSLLEASEHAKEQAASQSRTRHAPRDTSYDDSLLRALADPKEAAAYLDAVMEMEDAAALMLAITAAIVWVLVVLPSGALVLAFVAVASTILALRRKVRS